MAKNFFLYLLGALGLGAGALVVSEDAEAAKPKPVAGSVPANLVPLFKKWGTKYAVDWRLLAAHAKAESDFNPKAINPRDPSVGLMQILCTGWPHAARNKFHITGWPPDPVESLIDPDLNVMFGAQILASNIASHGWPRGTAMYNAYDQRLRPVNGPFKNQAYVDRVVKFYDQFKAEYPQ